MARAFGRMGGVGLARNARQGHDTAF